MAVSQSAFTVSQWAKMVLVDSLDGVKLLAAALYLRAKMRADHAISLAEKAERAANGDIDPFFSPDLSASPEELRREADERVRKLKAAWRALRNLGGEDWLDQAASVSVRSFRWRWFHFRDFPLLVAYVKPNLPEWSAPDKEQPIAQRWGDSLTAYLERLVGDVVEGSYCDLHRFDVDYPRGRDESEWGRFYATFDLHQEPRGKGHPNGRRWRDGLNNAWSYAWSIRYKAEQAGTPMTTAEAVRESVREFQVVTEREFGSHPDPESCIVVNAGGCQQERIEAAEKAVRKYLDEYDPEGPLPPPPSEPPSECPFSGCPVHNPMAAFLIPVAEQGSSLEIIQ